MDVSVDGGRPGGIHFRTASYRVESLNSYQQFLSVKGHWDDLFKRAIDAYPTTSHAWLSAWWRTFGNDRPLYIVLVWDGDALIGSAPLLYDTKEMLRLNLRVLRPWVNEWVDCFNFLVVEPVDQVVDAIFNHLDDINQTWDLLELPRMDSNSVVTESFLRACRARDRAIGVEDDLQSPVLRLPNSWDELLTTLSPSFRQTLKRKVRAAHKIPGLRMRVITEPSVIEPIIEISKESWQHEQGTSIASRADIRAFYQAVIESYAKREQLYCALMEVDGEPAAFELNLAHQSTMYNFKLGFKKKFSHLSTGVVLKAFFLEEILQPANNNGRTFDTYDFMGTAEDYKLRWSKFLRAQNQYIVFSNRGSARRLHKWLYVVRPYMRERMPALYSLAKRVSNGVHMGRT